MDNPPRQILHRANDRDARSRGVSPCRIDADIDNDETAAAQLPVTRDVVYDRKDGLALTFDVYRPAQPMGAGVITIVSGGWQSTKEMSRLIVDGSYLSPLREKGFTVFAVRHGSGATYPLSGMVSDVRRAVRFIRRHAGDYDIDANRIGVLGDSSGGQLALLLGTTGDSGDPLASDAVLGTSSRVGAVVAWFPVADLSRWNHRWLFKATALPEHEAARYSPVCCAGPGGAPSLIIHGDADTLVPIVQSETMHAALVTAGVPTSLMRIEGAGHDISGADLQRGIAAMVHWFEQYLGSGTT